MARKTIVFTVEADNRDKGKTFKITEMPARKAEEWAIQVACAVMGAGVSVPDDVMSAIGAAVAPAPAVEIKQHLSFMKVSWQVEWLVWLNGALPRLLRCHLHSRSLFWMSCLPV